MASDNRDVLVVDGLKTYFHQDRQFVRAVDDVSFRVEQGGLFGLAGESGSGKTQTALSVAGLVGGTPGVVAGDVWINGTNVLDELETYCSVDDTQGGLRIRKDVQRWRTHREERMASLRGSTIGMVFQEPRGSLSPYFTVGEQAKETVATHFGPDAATTYEERVRPLLKRMEFGEPGRILSSYPHELSGGQSQRVMLTLALLTEPEMLIADEPTTALDAITERHVLDLFVSVIEERSLALLLITHDLGVMARLVNDVAIMRHGKIVEQGPVSRVMNGALGERHPYTRQLREAAERSGVLIHQ
jgi:ABC-type dipeptide/oligopeptide/nickel transport system ATPase component